MSRQTIGANLASKLYEAETAIDSALARTAELAAMLPTARADAYLSAVTGQKVFSATAASISSLTEARANLVDSHGALAALARKLGLDVLATGPIDKPEDERPNGVGYPTATKAAA